MDFLISVAGKIAEYAIEPVGRQFGYLIYYNSNIETLKTKVEKLEDVRLRMAGSVAAAERRGDIVFPDVGKWLSSVDQIREESTEFLKNQVNQNQKCFSRQLPCPDLVSRYRVSRKSSKKSLQVDGLLNDRINFGDQVSTPAPPPSASSMFPGDIEAFDSRKSTFEAIMKALEDDKVKMIGVYGMGGIGKTTMVKQVAKEAEKRKLFDEFAMAVVSQNPDVRKIQSEIAEHLELKLDEETESVRAGRLFERMNQGKRILLVLDDLWDLIDLEKIRIPRKCCKIILTSRKLNVCNTMECESCIPIQVLSHTDALSYFRAIAIGNGVDSPYLRPIATEIVEKCAGLPIAIKTIGLALKGKMQYEYWNDDVLKQLRNSTPQNIEGVPKNLYGVLEVSYNLLDSYDLKYCFLICSLFEEDADISIEDLVRYGLGLNLFQTRDRAHVLVDKLKDCSLLMKGKTDNSVIMHDVIRDFAHYLAFGGREHVFLVRQGKDITEWPDSDKCGDYTAISLLSHQISELPEGLDCPKLQILIFESVWRSPMTKLKIPSNFFQGMKQLRVLNMSNCSMPSIPASIVLLEGLETLCLEFCNLGDLSQIGGLKKLKVLSLAQSDFKELPSEIGLLTNLMILDLTDCDELKVVPPNLISNMIKLECLYVLSFDEQWSWGGSNATVGEFKYLHHLNTLEMYVPDINLLPNDLPFQKLIRFRVYIRNYKLDYWDLRRDLEKMLVIQLEPDHNNTLPTGVKTLMKRAQALVVEFKGYNYPTEEYPHPSALSDLNEDGFKNLKYLKVKKNFSMKYLIDSSNASTPTRSFFPLLEELQLEKLGLNEICRDDLPDGSFGKLRELKLSNLPNLTKLWSMNDSARYPRLVNLRSVQISHCKELKHVFPQSAFALLGQLESLTVVDCESLEGIILEDRPEMGDIIHLPKLQILKIHRVPSLTRFCFQMNKAPTGQLIDTKILLPALEELDFAGLDWLTQLLLESSCILRKINISDCKRIVTVFPSNVQHCLQNLASLSIIGCESLEAILEADITSTSMLPQLQQQHHKLDQLRQPKLPRGFPSLKEINISNCPKMKAFAAAAATSMVDYNAININVADLTPPFFNETIVFPALQKLELSGLHDVKEIWHPRLFSSESFHRLMNVIVRNCNSLVTIFPSSVLRRLKNLEFIEISNCELVEEVVGFDDEDAATVTVEFSHLKELTIIGCPKMKTFLAAHKHNIGGDFIQPFFHEKIVFPALQELRLSNLHDVKEIWHPRLFSSESFHKLTNVKVNNCNSLVTIFPSSALRSLKNLKLILISSCELVEEVVGFDDEDAATVTVEFSHLILLIIFNCPKMKTFLAAHKHNIGGDFIQPFFHEKIVFPALQELRLSNLHDVKEIWHPRLFSSESFHKLTNVEVNNCNSLVTIFPSSVLRNLKSLERIEIEHCELVEEVFGFDDEDAATVTVEFSHLKRLEIDGCPKMKTFLAAHKNNIGGDFIQPFFNEKIVFPALQELMLRNLHDVKEIWHPQLFSSVLRNLKSLERIEIEHCELVEEVFGFDDEDAATVTVEFSHLKRLEIDGCPKMKTFLAAHKHNIGGDFIKPFFNEKIVFPALQELRLRNLHDVKEIWHPQLFSSVLRNLKSLERIEIEHCELVEEVFGFDDEDAATVTFEFSHLKELKIDDCPKMKTFLAAHKHNIGGDFIQPFFNEKVDLPVLEELYISGVEGVEDLWHDRSQAGSLRELSLRKLPKLTELWWNKDGSGKFSCPDLRSLEVGGCHGLRNIFVPSAIKHDMNIQKLKIWNCSNMEEVVGEEEQGEYSGDKLLFRLVEVLSLEKLPNLRTFCRGNYILEWPSLSKMVMNNCPNMTNFCLGPVITPLLKGLSENEYTKEVWMEGSNLNDIFQHPYFNKIVFSGRGALDLELRDLHDVKELGHPQLFSIERFRRLRYVKVTNCNSLVTIFSSSVLRRLNNLETIWIENCELVEEVFGFHDEDAATVSVTAMMMMIPLRYIYLTNLPNLMHFGQSGTVESSHLIRLTIINCPKMKTFLAAHKHNLSGDFIQPFFQEKVDLHVLEELYISGVEGVEDLWHDRSQAGSLRELSLIELPKLTELWWNKDRSGKFSCPDLRSLTVARCHGLRNIFVPSAIKHDMNIQKLTIADCSNMEEVVGEEEHGEYSGDKLLFRLVKELSLKNLPNLRTFCRGNYILEWSSLSKMVMNNCPNMANFCLGPVITPLLKGLSEIEDNKEVLREGSNLNDIIQHLYNQKEIVAKEKQEEETSGTREAHLE